MVQALLGDRFKLKLHRETREIPVSALLVGKGGPKFEDSGRRNSARGHIAAGLLVAHDAPMAEFADVLTTNPGRPVLDRTGLGDRYDFSLTWDQPVGADLPGPLYDLGLRREARKAPVEMMVIDSVDRPSGN
jgi:uncharacterized protein (TIGR03435 family)